MRQFTVSFAYDGEVRVVGLAEGEEFRVISSDFFYQESARNSLFENTPLDDVLVLLLVIEGNEVKRHKAAFECEVILEVKTE